MALKGKGIKKAIPYIPEIERGTDTPTVFWIKPKNMGGTYKTLELYSKGVDTNRNIRKIHPTKMFEADIQDFLSFCEKVENYQFSDDFSELAAKGLITIEDAATFRLLVQDLDPTVFQEVQNATTNWEMLTQGQEAYQANIEFKAATASKPTLKHVKA